MIMISCKTDARTIEPAAILEVAPIEKEANIPTSTPTSSNEEVVSIVPTPSTSTETPTELPTKSDEAQKEDKKEEVVTTEVITPTEVVAEVMETPSTLASTEKTNSEIIEDKLPEVKEVETVKETKKEEMTAEIETPKVETPTVIADIHDPWNAMLKKYVTASGVVNYTGLKAVESQLDAYLATLSSNTPKTSDLSNKAKAFWINAYNAYTVKLILKNFPLNSIRDIDGGEPWSTKWIQLGGKTYSLNNIEHDILRPNFKDGRVHFAVNCAAISCPKIANEAFAAGKLDAQLDKMTKAFVANPKANKISANAIQLSKIFDWYKEDFGDLVGFIDQYTEVDLKGDAAISYFDYDWSLNGK